MKLLKTIFLAIILNCVALHATQAQDNAPQIFTVVEQMPEYVGGEDAMHQFISSSLKYPTAEKNKNITGTVYVTMVINVDGSLSNISVLRGVKNGTGLDNEALRVIKAMPKWNAGMHNGKPSAVQYNLPIRFSLN
ncbi:MAG: energy transducer TonB [Bacteroidia bacterium]|nr:energy transducer TonB [Bacteroidia bacterium]